MGLPSNLPVAGPDPGIPEAELAARVCSLLEQAGAGRDAVELITLLTRNESEIDSLCGEILERYEEASLVYRLAERLGDVTDEDDIATLVLRDAARVLGAPAGEVWLRKGPAVELAATVPDDRPADGIDQAGPLAALSEGRAWVQDAGRGQYAAIAVPLPTPGGSPIGALVLRGRTDGRSYRTGEVKLLTALASVTSAFVRNGRLADRALATEARKREHEIAQQIYQRLLPDRDPDCPGLEIATVCRAADRIGGDYYGFLDMPDGSLAIAMADISGHGVGAGLYMAATKGVLQAEAKRIVSPSDLLRRTNEALSADFSKFDIFATAFVARFATGARRLEYSNSGHPPPLFIRGDGRVERLDRGGLALGVLPNVIYQEESRCFDPGDLLVIYTDGLIEARNADDDFYGLERLERVSVGSRNLPASEVRDCILADLDRYTGNIPVHDDVTLVVARGVEADGSGAEGSDE